MVGWAQARPRRVLAAVLVLALVGAGLALWRLSPTASTDTLVGSGSDAGRATDVVHARFGDDAVYVLVRGDLARTVLTADLNRAARARGLPVGQRAARCFAAGGCGFAVCRPGAGEARARGLRAGDVHQLLGVGDHGAAAGADALAGGPGRPRQGGGAGAGPVAGPLARRGAAAGRAGREARLRAVRERAVGLERQVRPEPDRGAEAQRPGLRLPARVRPGARRARAEGALRLPVPVR